MTEGSGFAGIKCFSIAGRMIDARQRCLGMTDEERRWRAQWLKDQVLSHDEPRYVPEYYKQTNNFFRRLWKTPMNKFQQFLEPKLGPGGAYLTRHSVGKIFNGLVLVYIGTYFFKYHVNDFVPGKTIEIYTRRKRMYPFHPDYPNYVVAKTPSDYYDQGFYSSVLCQDVEIKEEEIPPPPPPPINLEEPEVCPALAKEE